LSNGTSTCQTSGRAKPALAARLNVTHVGLVARERQPVVFEHEPAARPANLEPVRARRLAVEVMNTPVAPEAHSTYAVTLSSTSIWW